MIFLLLLIVIGGLFVTAHFLERMGRIERELEEFQRWRRSLVSLPDAKAVPRDVPAPEPVAPVRHPEAVASPLVGAASAPPAAAPPPPRTPAVATTAPVEPVTPAPPARSAEQMIGGIWLQNVGSVLLLLGAFFFILWGYTTGRIGPGVLVAAGVALGVFVGWRGDRMARNVPAFGHALIGIGIGVAYISLYLGHFALGVLSPVGTTVLLGVTSIVGILIGQRYRVQTIAVLAVIGAFVPQIAAVMTGSPGFVDSPALLLLYVGAIDATVFALAARSRWPALALLALLLTTGTWISAVGAKPWDGPVTWGLATLYVGLGLASVPRLVRDPQPLGGLDAAVIVTAPYLFAVAAWPALATGPRLSVGGLLLALGLVEAAAAAAVRRVDSRGELFNVIVTAAVVFVTAALERLLDSAWTPMTWTVEGVALASVGVLTGSAWLRTLGALAAFLGLLAGLPAESAIASSRAGPPLGEGMPLLLFTANSVRSLVTVLAFFVGARVLERERARLKTDEAEFAPVAWAAVAEFALLCWLGVHAARLAGVIVPGSGIPGLPDDPAADIDPLGARRFVLQLAIMAFAWSVQAAATIARGYARRTPSWRALGYVVAATAAAAFVFSQAGALASQNAFGTAWKPADGAFVHPAGLFQAATLLLFALGAGLATRARAGLAEWEKLVPEALTIVLAALTWTWLGTESSHLGRILASGQNATVLGCAIASLAWSLQAFFSLALGVLRRLPYRRLLGYSIGVTAALAFLTSLAASAAFPLPGFAMAGRNLASEFLVTSLALWLLGVTLLARHRKRLLPSEEKAPEVLTFAFNLMLMCWTAQQASLYARFFGTMEARRFAAVATSGAWVLQAATLFLVGWRARSPFLRWLGLGLFGVTLAKVALFDLAFVDVFWRFLVAIGFGAVLLAISYVYQRSRLGGRTEG